MRSFRATRILTSVLACRMDASNGGELEREYSYTAPSLNERSEAQTIWDGFRRCQTCLLDIAGVSRVSLLSTNHGMTARMRITSTSFGFQRMLKNCDNDRYCGSLKWEMPPPRAILNHPNAMEHRKPIPSSARSFEIEQFSLKVMCLVHSGNVDESCRTCLREASNSKILGEFFFTDAARGYFSTVQRTSRNRNEIVLACKALGVCEIIYYSKLTDQICDEIHDTEVSISMRRAQRENYHRMDREPDKRRREPTKNHLYCVEVEIKSSSSSPHRGLVSCMECFGAAQNSIVHSFKSDDKRERLASLLIRPLEIDFFLDRCQEFCVVREFVPINKCYEDYDKQFDDTPSVGNQISWNMPESSRESINTDEYSGCLLAYHQSTWMSANMLLRSFKFDTSSRKECTKCLQMQFRDYVSRLSGMTSLVAVSAADQKKAGNCFHHDLCTRLTFIPDEMCLNDLAALNENQAGSSRQALNIKRLATQSGQMATVVKATYTNPTCLVCLALLYEVIMVSTVKMYVWILGENGRMESVPVCQFCVTSQQPMPIDIRSMRPISAAMIQFYVYEEIRNKLDHDGLVRVCELPINDPFFDSIMGTW